MHHLKIGEVQKNTTITKGAKEIPLYQESHVVESNGTFTCPAVALILKLSVEVNSLKLLIANQSTNPSAKLDNADLLREYKISRGTAIKWRNEGLAYTKIGNKIFYERDDISKFLDQYNEKAF